MREPHVGLQEECRIGPLDSQFQIDVADVGDDDEDDEADGADGDEVDEILTPSPAAD